MSTCCNHDPVPHSAAPPAHELPEPDLTQVHPQHQQHTPATPAKGGCCGCGTSAPAQPLGPGPATKVAGGIRSTLRILQMDCPTEETLIRNKLAAIPAVGNLDFNLMQRTLTVEHAPDALDAVLNAIRSLGFEPELTGPGRRTGPVDESPPLRWWPLAAAGMFALAAEALDWFGQPAMLAAACALAAIAISGTGTYRKGWIAIRNGNLNINALMSIAVTGAMLLGEWPEAAMVMVLFSVAEAIEARSLDRARNAIRGLMQLVPPSASVVNTDGSVTRVDAGAVAVGQVVRVRPGERVGLDGIVINGRSTLNQAPISGESLPIDKGPGDTVFAGSINESGAFDYRVTAAANDTTLARIIHAVEEAQGAKAPTQRFIDRFARIYTPVVFALALAVAVLPPVFAAADWHEWIYKALVLLVIACPCALVISTPVTIVSGLAAAARRGILIKGGVYLENGRKLAWLAFDKTGTLTHGKPEQTDFESIGDVDAERCVRLAASLAERSDHPVSQAIARAAAAAGVTPDQVESFEAIGGRGVRATIDGARYALGNHRMLHEQALCSDALEARVDMLERQGKTVVALFDDARVLGLFAVADTLKDSSLAAVAELHRLGVKTLMLSGDNPHTVQAIAHALGIDEARGNLLPADKLAAIEHLAAQGMVGMAGDGINDAPAIARADIGFAMGAMGTDTAIETADVALMDDDLGKIATFVRLSRSTHALLVQNIALALGIKAVFLLLTLAGMSTMWMAVFADMGASLIVVGNGLRLLRKA